LLHPGRKRQARNSRDACRIGVAQECNHFTYRLTAVDRHLRGSVQRIDRHSRQKRGRKQQRIKPVGGERCRVQVLIYDLIVNKLAKKSDQCTHGNIDSRGQSLFFMHDLAENPQALRRAQQKVTHRFFIQPRIEDPLRLSANNGRRE